MDVSGARSPTKMLYSLGYCCCADGAYIPLLETKAAGMGDEEDAELTEEAQLSTKGFDELGIVTGLLFEPLLTWARTEAAWAGVGNVRKQ